MSKPMTAAPDPETFAARAGRAVREGARPVADRSTGLHALKLAQIRQQIREGRPEAVEGALRAAGMLVAGSAKSSPAGSGAPGMPDVRWFVIQTRPGGEGVALKALSDAGFRACAPTVGYWVTAHRRDVVRSSYVFPRYAFVGLVPDRRGDIDFRSPRLCDGVANFLEGAGGRVEVRDTAVGDLMAASELGWLEMIHERVMRPQPKRLRSADFLRTMGDIMRADAASRMRLFLQHFGERRTLSERVTCGMSDA